MSDLRDEIAAAIKCCGEPVGVTTRVLLGRTLQSCDAEIDRLRRELAEARRDAERYRWLSSQNDPIIWEYLGGMDDDQIDEAIDKWIADDAFLAATAPPAPGSNPEAT